MNEQIAVDRGSAEDAGRIPDDLLVCLDGRTRRTIENLLASLSDEMRTGVAAAVAALDGRDDDLQLLLAAMKNEDVAALDPQCCQALRELLAVVKRTVQAG